MKSLSENNNLSILEIFSVMFPGGAMLLLCWQVPDIQGTMRGVLPDMGSEWQVSIAFLGVAYFLGYVLFYVSSFLDEVIYDRFKSKKQALSDSVIKIKTATFGYDNKDEINAFKWSSALLLAKQPAMFAAVERLMAASKFFRSMVVVLCLAALLFAFQGGFIGAIVAFSFAVISLFNYIRQREKAVEAAYQYVITVDKF
jgi:ABC-type multidrug transport system fused ATPase/permease subunit